MREDGLKASPCACAAGEEASAPPINKTRQHPMMATLPGRETHALNRYFFIKPLISHVCCTFTPSLAARYAAERGDERETSVQTRYGLTVLEAMLVQA